VRVRTSRPNQATQTASIAEVITAMILESTFFLHLTATTMVYGFSQLSHSIHVSKPRPTDVLTNKHRVSHCDGFEKDKTAIKHPRRQQSWPKWPNTMIRNTYST
jgi:hypothetical protein